MAQFTIGILGKYVEPPPPPLWTPTQISSSLELWLKADTGVVQSGGNVSSWTDQSGKSRSFTASTANGLDAPILSGSGTNSAILTSYTTSLRRAAFLQGLCTAGKRIAVYMIGGVEPFSGQTTNTEYYILSESTNTSVDSYWSPFYYQTDSTGNVLTGSKYYFDSSSSVQIVTIDNTSAYKANNYLVNYSTNIFSYYLDRTTSRDTSSRFNDVYSGSINTAVDPFQETMSVMQLGGKAVPSYSYNPGTGFISIDSEGGPASFFKEVIVADITSSFANHDKIEGYLAWRHGVQSRLDNAHPYKLEPPYL